MNQLQRKRELLILLVAFVVSVFARIPNLDRPLSKHHEFNSAVVLNNAISWQEAGGASVYNYVPVMTYPGIENRLLEQSVNTDTMCNQLYLSLGPGFFVLPYLIFNGFHISATPLGLQTINLLIHLLLVLAIYRLGILLTRQFDLQRRFGLYCCIAFLFMPGPLWYLGNGYVHTAVALPFAVVAFTLFLQQVFFHKKLTVPFIAGFCSMGILSIYMDWFAFFLLATIAAFGFYMFIKTKAMWWFKVALLSSITAVVGVALVFLQFASLLGWPKVWHYWRERFASRSFDMEQESLTSHFVSFGANLATCAGIAVIFSGVALFTWLKKRKEPAYAMQWQPLVLLWGVACIFYNGLFFNWSFIHEFSMLPISVLLAILTAFFVIKNVPEKYAVAIMAGFTAISLAQYYTINKPGNISRVGTPYNTQLLVGKTIGTNIPKDYKIFSNLVNDPVVEYYAHRSIYAVPSQTEAQQLCNIFHINKAVWVQCDSMKISKVVFIKP